MADNIESCEPITTTTTTTTTITATPTPTPTTTATGKRKRRGPTTKRSENNKKKIDKNSLFALLTGAVAAVHTFLTQNDTNLLPSQTLSLESLLSQFPLFPHSPPSLPSPPPTFYDRFLSSSASSNYDPRWRHLFNMSRPTFSTLLSLLSPCLPPSLPADSALAASLFRLAHAASYPSLAAKFGFDSPDSACHAFYEVCKAVIAVLGGLIVESRADLERIVLGFGWISLPNCCGVLGFGRFGVDSDSTDVENSVLVQALVDSEGRFLDISAGWPHTMRPDSVLTQTKLYSSVGDLLTAPRQNPGEGNASVIPRYVLGDSCFPILPWLLTPYRSEEVEEDDSRLGFVEREFNAAHSRAMGLVRTTFKRVKLRWQLLRRRWKEESVEFLPFVIVMGCLLHNFLIKFGEPVPEEIGVRGCFVNEEVEEEFPCFVGEGDENGKQIRDMLAEHLSRISMRP